MSNPLFALVAAAALAGSPQDGEAWLREAESRLYAWPDPGVVVTFKVKTDVLTKTIEGMRKQLPPNPPPEMVKAIDALRRLEVLGTLDTATGIATTEIDLPLDTTDPVRKQGVDQIKQGIATMVSKAFECLPLHDPSLLSDGRKVLEAVEKGDAITVKVSGATAAETTTIKMSRARMLPEGFENASMSLKIRYVEVLPGRFAPAKLDIALADGQKSAAAFTYQRVGELVFPATVAVTHGTMTARMEFLSVRAGK